MPLGSLLKPYAMAQMQTPAPQASSPVVDDMGFDPENMLLALINQISTKLDTDRVFDQPVSEEVAPGYHDFIKRPMCFQRMRDKVSHLVPLHGSSCASSSHAMLFLTINLQCCHNLAELLDLKLACFCTGPWEGIQNMARVCGGL